MPANLENSAVATGLEKVSFHSNAKEGQCHRMFRLQLHSFHTLAKQCSKFSRQGFNSTWTENFQMFKLDLEKAEEQEIKLPTSAASSKKTENSKKNIYFCFIDHTKAFDCVDHNKLCKILNQIGIPDHLTCLLRNLYASQKQQLELDMEQQTGSISGKEYIKVVYCHLVYLTYMQSTSCEMSGLMKPKL